jgi:hypothetical protein
VPSQVCGLTLCTGSFGSNPNNDLVAMAKEFAPRIHFVHLRNTRHEPDGSFYEAEHLDGHTDLLGMTAAIMDEEARQPDQRCSQRGRRSPRHGGPSPAMTGVSAPNARRLSGPLANRTVGPARTAPTLGTGSRRGYPGHFAATTGAA